MNNSILTRTKSALGKELITQIKKHKYCIVGCGGTGALFAEMLVRTGAQHISLVDGGEVEASNLNRTPSFVQSDIGEHKVGTLSSRLEEINPNVKVTPQNCHIRNDKGDRAGQGARDAVYDADIVIIAVDNNQNRIMCENLCYEDSNKKVLSIGVYVHLDGAAGYECAWCPRTPAEKADEEGYGNGSYASIVIEATAAAFTMLLHNLANPNSKEFNYLYKSYKNFVPTCRETKP